jgi:autophagy-related protein 13
MDKTDQLINRQQSKFAQVIQNFFVKAAQIILQSRTLPENSPTNSDKKLNKWFNLYMYNNNVADLKIWKNHHNLQTIPPMIIETYLDLRQLTPNQVVILQDEHQNIWQVLRHKKQEIVLERWLIEFDANDVGEVVNDELPSIYKQSIILFRSLYGLSRILPTFKLKKILSMENSGLIISNKIIEGTQQISSKGRIGLSKSIIPHQMMTTENHITHKQFQPIRTTSGTLKVSIAYRNQYRFSVQDSEQLLSNQFVNMDEPRRQSSIDDTLPGEIIKDLHRKSIDLEMRKSLEEPSVKPIPKHHGTEIAAASSANKFSNSMSISPCTSGREMSPSIKKPTPPTKLPIQPFRIGSLSISPPPTGSTASTSLERRISITSNKSTSNASLAALLRNPRGSTSSATSTGIPIGNQSSYPSTVGSSFPRSVSSSHGHDDQVDSSTPRFSSSFGTRANRRFSNASNRQTLGPSNQSHNELLGTSAGLTTSTKAPLSGLYADDDISDFVKMIDSTVDLRFAHGSNQFLTNHSGNSIDQLNKFQSLRLTHQQLGENVSASVMLQQHQLHQPHHHSLLSQNHTNDSRSHVSSMNLSGDNARSRKSSTGSPQGSLPSDNTRFPSIISRLQEESPGVEEFDRAISMGAGNNSSGSNRGSFGSYQANVAFMKSTPMTRLASPPCTSTSMAYATAGTTTSEKSGEKKAVASAPSPSKYKEIKYENVFDDDDDDEYEENHDELVKSSDATHKSITRGTAETGASNLIQRSTGTEIQNTMDLHYLGTSQNRSQNRRHSHSHSHSSLHSPDDDDDDLLFAMSDMNLTKH